MMNRRSCPMLFLVVLLVWLGVAPSLPAADMPRINEPGWFSAKTDQILDRVADVAQKKIRLLEKVLNDRQHLDFEIPIMFYDRQLRRLFLEYRGVVRFTGKWPTKIKSEDLYCTSDGTFAWDCSLTDMKVTRESVTFNVHGDLVISLDKLLFELASELTQAATTVAWYQGADQLLEFLQRLDCDILARSVHKTISSFSRESASVLVGELFDNSSRPTNPEFKRRVKEALQDGSVTTYLVLTIMKSSISSLAGIGGAGLGGVVGNLLVPGPGAIVGAYLGGKISSTLAKTVVYKLSVDLPVKFCLYKIVKHGRELQKYPRSEAAGRGMERIHRFVTNRVKHEVDREEYKALDHILAGMNDHPAEERFFFVPLLKSFQEMLRFKVIEEHDWYASKKYYQLKQRVSDWGLLQRVPF